MVQVRSARFRAQVSASPGIARSSRQIQNPYHKAGMPKVSRAAGDCSSCNRVAKSECGGMGSWRHILLLSATTATPSNDRFHRSFILILFSVFARSPLTKESRKFHVSYFNIRNLLSMELVS